MPDNKSNNGVAAVDRALTILKAFHDSKAGALSLAALAAHTGLYKSTILRLVNSLEEFGYIRQIPDGRYKLGPIVSALGQLYLDSFRLSEFIQPTLDTISDITKESASLYVRDGDYQVIRFRSDTNHRIRDYLKVGDTSLITEGGASAKSLQFFSTYNGEPFDPATFCQFSFGERNPEVAGVAAPIIDHQHKLLGAIAVTGPLFRFTEEKANEIAQILTQEAINLSLRMGASSSVFRLFTELDI